MSSLRDDIIKISFIAILLPLNALLLYTKKMKGKRKKENPLILKSPHATLITPLHSFHKVFTPTSVSGFLLTLVTPSLLLLQVLLLLFLNSLVLNN